MDSAHTPQTHIITNTLVQPIPGVDVFFVISGYLITSILLNKLATGTFSLLDFWTRRWRRLFPALVRSRLPNVTRKVEAARAHQAAVNAGHARTFVHTAPHRLSVSSSTPPGTLVSSLLGLHCRCTRTCSLTEPPKPWLLLLESKSKS